MVPRILDAPPPLVLVVEDDAETRRLVTEALAPGFVLVTVLDAPAAPGAGIEPDLLVVGAGRARPDTALQVRLERGLHEVPVLLVADAVDDEVVARLLRHAAQDYVRKPFHPDELRARAQNLIAAKRTRDHLRRMTGSDAAELEALAREAGRQKQALVAELAAAGMARDRVDRVSRTKTAFLRTVGHELGAVLSALRETVARLGREDAAALAASVDWIAELCAALIEYAHVERESD